MEMPKSILAKEDCQRFITLPDEQLVFAQRKHWIVFFAPLFTTIILSVIFALASYFLFFHYLYLPSVFLGTLGFLSSLMVGLGVKIYLDWYYQLYVITNRKIIEIGSAPLVSHHINDVLLDQVRITEVDIVTKGFIHQLIDMGDVVIDFDRISYIDKLVFTDIQDPDTIGHILAHTFGTSVYKEKDASNTVGNRRNFGYPGMKNYQSQFNKT